MQLKIFLLFDEEKLVLTGYELLYFRCISYYITCSFYETRI